MEMKPFSQISDGFEKSTRSEWKAQLVKELKDGNPSLLEAQITDGISIPGWLDQTVVTNILEADLAMHAEWADHPNAWKIAEEIPASDAAASNDHALEALSGGVSVLRFTHADNLNVRLKNIHPEMCELIFDRPNLALGQFGNLEMLADSLGKIFSEFSGLVSKDLISDGIMHGGFLAPVDEWIFENSTLLNHIVGLKTQHMLHEIDGLPWRMAGGNHVDVLSNMLAHGADILHLHQQRGNSLKEAAERTFFRYPVGTDFLRDVAAIRALRVMWKAILHEYGVQINSIRVDAAMPFTELSALDVNTNMLRYTSAAISATMAGCFALYASPFNFGETAHARRIARNVSLLLDSESHFSRVVDPLKGAYAIEALTEALAEAAWKQFNQIETNGGLIACIENNSIQNELAKKLSQRAEKLKLKHEVKVGVNKFAAHLQPTINPVFASENRGQFSPLKIAGIDQMCSG